MMELVFMMTKGGPGGSTEVVPWYLYATGFNPESARLAGVRVLDASGVEYPNGVDEALVADIYRAMEAAKRSDPAAVRSW